MEIVRLNMESLVALMHSEKVKHWKNLPISLFRLKSQSINPFLLKDDIVMILLMENGDLLGYLGALPDEIITGNEHVHVAWASSLWICEWHRAKGFATVLIKEMDEAWNNKLVITDFAGGSQVMYDRTNLFEELKIKKGVRYFYKADFFQLSSERLSLSKARYIFKIADCCINTFQEIRFQVTAKKILQHQYSEGDFESLKKLANSTFKHTKEKTGWIVTNPWITTKESEKCSNYYFTTLATIFYFKEIKFIDSNRELLGTITYSNLDNHCKILHTVINCNPERRKHFSKLIDQYFCSIGTRSVLSYDNDFNELMSYSKGSWFFKKRRERVYIAGKALHRLIGLPNQLSIHEIDGDVVFT